MLQAVEAKSVELTLPSTKLERTKTLLLVGLLVVPPSLQVALRRPTVSMTVAEALRNCTLEFDGMLLPVLQTVKGPFEPAQLAAAKPVPTTTMSPLAGMVVPAAKVCQTVGPTPQASPLARRTICHPAMMTQTPQLLWICTISSVPPVLREETA